LTVAALLFLYESGDQAMTWIGRLYSEANHDELFYFRPPCLPLADHCARSHGFGDMDSVDEISFHLMPP
jgi:hypothetical protein